MNVMRKLTLLVVGTIATLAMSAGTAAAAIEVTAEGGGHCSDVSIVDHALSGGCQLSASGANVERRDFLGIMHLCNWTFVARLNEAGEGSLANISFSGCNEAPCREADGHATPWPAELTTEGVAGAPHILETVICVTGAFGIIANCHLAALEVRQTSHTFLTMKTPGTLHTSCEGNTNAWLGTWNMTSPAPGVEIT